VVITGVAVIVMLGPGKTPSQMDTKD
jgi:hypothetical protein